jgi:hypothetical protein
METVVSISGGMSSAHIAAMKQHDKLVFALVRTGNPKYQFKDRVLAQKVSDRIGKEFTGTLEDDTIIYTILDLEQYLGERINWVAGITFEELIERKSGYLPNVMTRYCTTELKIRPIFHWWHDEYKGEPIIMPLGYRAGEISRKVTELDKLNEHGLSEFKATFEKHPSGRNKWVTMGWRVPTFPLIDNHIYKQDVNKFWIGKKVRFAPYNNCVGCFHRSASFLKKMSLADPLTFDWFINAEKENKGFFKKDVSYAKIDKLNFTQEMDFDSEGCGSGFCGF